VRGEWLVRIIALIGLCALVYYFSFDQGRRSLQVKIARLESEIQSKDRMIEALAMEVRRQKEKTARLEKQIQQSGGTTTPAATPEKPQTRFLVRLGATRMLFEQRLAVALVDLDRFSKTATLKLNYIESRRTQTVKVQVGQSLPLSLDGASFTLLVEELQPNAVVLRVFPVRG